MAFQCRLRRSAGQDRRRGVARTADGDRAGLGGALTLLVSFAVVGSCRVLRATICCCCGWPSPAAIGVVFAYAGLSQPPSASRRKPITLAELSHGSRLIGSDRWFRCLLIGRRCSSSVELAICSTRSTPPRCTIRGAESHRVRRGDGIGMILSGFLSAGMSNSARMLANSARRSRRAHLRHRRR